MAAPLVDGLMGPPPPRFGPMVVGKLAGFCAFATRLNAPRHWRTWAGSLLSYKSTVRKRSCAGMLSGGCSQARRKCDIFSICMKGMADFLNLTPGLGMARLTSLHNTVPSLSASSKSPAGSRSPRTSSIQARTSFAACGVYLSMRNFFMSWSSEVTEAMLGEIGRRSGRQLLLLL